MSEYNTLEKFLYKVYKRKILFYYIRNFLFYFILVNSLFIELCLIDYYFYTTVVIRFGFIILSVIFFLFFILLSYIQKNRIKFQDIILEIQDKYTFLSDDLINAWQLNKNIDRLIEHGLSKQLTESHIQKTTSLISEISVKDIVNFNIFKKLLPSFIVITGLYLILIYNGILNKEFSRIIYTDDNIEFEKNVKVIPGNIKLPLGSKLNIIIEILTETIYKPDVYLKSENKAFEKLKLFNNKNKFISQEIYLNYPIEYYVEWRRLRSKKYRIEPSIIPKLGNFSIKYFFPEYTMAEPKESKMFDEIPCIKGTRIEFTAVSNNQLKTASLITTWGTKIPLKIVSKDSVYGKFIVIDSGELYFEVEDIEGNIDSNPTKYRIDIVKDYEPEVQILSPKEDIVVSDDSKIPIIYKVNDDYGVSKVELIYKFKRNEKKICIKEYDPPVTENVSEYVFDMMSLLPLPGDVIEYFLQVYDNDTVSGPKKSYSETYRLEIFSYEKEHEQIEKELSNFRDDLLDLLGKQTSAKSYLDQLLKSERQIIEPERKKLIDLQKEIKINTSRLVDKLNKDLSRMELDPYTNYHIYNEYNYIQKGLSELEKNQMTKVIETAENNQYPLTNNLQEEIITNLERLNLLSEDVLQNQKMNDLISNSEQLIDITKDLIKDLYSVPNKEEYDKLNKVLDKLDKLMNEIQSLIQKFPQTLPEEFINQKAIKELDLSSLSLLSQNIRDYINKGNWRDALAQAEKMLQQAESLLKTLKESSDAVKNPLSDTNEVAKELQESLSELETIINQQEEVITDTSEMEKKRQELVLKEQEKEFLELIEKQKRAINLTKEIRNSSKKVMVSELTIHYDMITSQIIPDMERVYNELMNRKVVKSQELLIKIINQLVELSTFTVNNKQKIPVDKLDIYSEIKDGTEEVKLIEQEILNKLKSVPEVNFTNRDKQELQNISEKQNNNKTRTISLDRSLQELSRKTALITPEVSFNLRQAAHKMSDAQSGLMSGETNNALEDEIKALEYLNQSNTAVKNAIQDMIKMQSLSGQSMSGFLQSKSKGMFGSKIGYVKLPSKNDYIPSKELREELMKSLKEKYPENYEMMIKEYYKKLTR